MLSEEHDSNKATCFAGRSKVAFFFWSNKIPFRYKNIKVNLITSKFDEYKTHSEEWQKLFALLSFKKIKAINNETEINRTVFILAWTYTDIP